MIKVLYVPAEGPLQIVPINPTRYAFAALLGGPKFEADTQGWRRRVGAYHGTQEQPTPTNWRAATILGMPQLVGPVVFFGTGFTGPPAVHEADVPQKFLQFVASQFREIKE